MVKNQLTPLSSRVRERWRTAGQRREDEDMANIAEEVVKAATDAVAERQAAADIGHPLAAGAYAKAALVAALNMLADRSPCTDTDSHSWCWTDGALANLADEIEASRG